MECIKGVRIEKALPSNFADLLILYKEAYTEKAGLKPWPHLSLQDLKEAAFNNIQELAQPNVVCFLARRGKKYVGFIFGRIIERRVGSPKHSMFVEMCFITKTKRKLGIGDCLAKKMLELSSNLGLGSIEIMCNDELKDKWLKYGGAKIYNYLVKEL